MAEHVHCRTQAALFDVSHMGQVDAARPGRAAALERLVCGDIAGLTPGAATLHADDQRGGGIIDDLMVANLGAEGLFLVVNASRKASGLRAYAASSTGRSSVLDDRALLALQGPAAAAIMAASLRGRRTSVHGCRAAESRWCHLPGRPLRIHRRGRI